MKRLVLLCSLFLLCTPPAAGAGEREIAANIDAVARAQASLDMFSGTLLVAKHGKIVYSGAFGLANRDDFVPNRLETRYNVGSIGKTVTAVAIFQLIQDGKLRLSDPLEKFYPDFPFEEKKAITIAHLLTHTSGLGDYLEHEDYLARHARLRSTRDLLPLIYDQRPAFAAGARFQYSNSGAVLLGGIVEKVSGEPYAEYLRRHIFDPCGMKESGIAFEDDVLPNRAIGYTQNVDGSFASNVLTVPAPSAAGGLRTTVGDLLKFDQALDGELLLSAESKQAMFAPSSQRPQTASGWEVKEFHGEPYVGHSGGTDGVEAYFYRFTESGYALIVLSNYTNGAEELTSTIMALLFGEPYSLPTRADANFRLGYRMQGEGNLRDAATVFARNLTVDPPHLLSLFFAANVRIRGGFELDAAVDYLDRFLRLSGPNDFPPATIVWTQRGDACRRLGRAEEAIRSYRRALDIDPRDEQASKRLAELGVAN